MDLFPRARRALLTAYADTDAAIAAINVVDVDHYLLKPWEPPEEKLYPVLDAMLAAYADAPDADAAEVKVIGHRWSAPSFAAREFLARNAVPYRWVASDSPDGVRLLAAAEVDAERLPVVVTAGGRDAGRADDRRAGRGGGPRHRPDRGLLRPRGRRRRAGGPRRRGVRGVRRPAYPARRAFGDRWAGRAVLADRELPGLPGRGLRLPARRPGAAAGDEVRRGDPDDPGRHRAVGARRRAGGVLRRRDGGRRPHRHRRHRGLLPGARGPRRRRADRPRRLLRRRVDRGGQLHRQRRVHRRRARTPPGRRRCTSPGSRSR